MVAVKAQWSDGYNVIDGTYLYNKPSDRFRINLDSIDEITGRRRELIVADDAPNFGNYILIGSFCRIWPEIKVRNIEFGRV